MNSSSPPPNTHIVATRRGHRYVYDRISPHIYHGPGGTFRVKIQTSRIPYTYRTFKTLERAQAALRRILGKPAKLTRSIRKDRRR